MEQCTLQPEVYAKEIEFHPFLACTKCKTLTLRKVFLPMEKGASKREKKEKFDYVCSDCKFFLALRKEVK